MCSGWLPHSPFASVDHKRSDSEAIARHRLCLAHSPPTTAEGSEARPSCLDHGDLSAMDRHAFFPRKAALWEGAAARLSPLRLCRIIAGE